MFIYTLEDILFVAAVVLIGGLVLLIKTLEWWEDRKHKK